MGTGLQRLASCLVVMFMWAVLPGCGGGGDSPPQQSGGDTKSVPTVSFPMNIAPLADPPFQCGDPSLRTQAAIQKLNLFWGSKVKACACGKDAEAECKRNAFVWLINTFDLRHIGLGYIFYDADFLQELDSDMKSDLPADYVLAHEFGHNIHRIRGDNTFFLNSKTAELSADCLAGFYVGNQVQSGQVKSDDVTSTINLACNIGDQGSSLWFESGAHGTCGERVNNMRQGIDKFLGGKKPEEACPRF